MLGVHSYGEELRCHEQNGIRVSETLMPAGLQLDDHAHEAGQVCFVLEGSYREKTADGDHILRPGSIQFHAPGERHANMFAGETLALLVSFEPTRWVEVRRRRPLAASPLIAGMAEELRRELTTDALEGLSLLLLSRIAGEPLWLRDAESHIENHYESNVSLASVASAIGVHRGTLAAAFRRFRSTSVGQFIREIRVRRATALLREGVPLDEIALATGFADQAHFGRVFKKLTGTTPGRFTAPGRRNV